MTDPHPLEEVLRAAEAARAGVDRARMIACVAIASQFEGAPIEAIMGAREMTRGPAGAGRDLAYYLMATVFDLTAYRIAALTSGGGRGLNYSRRGVQHALDRVSQRRDADADFDARLDRLSGLLRDQERGAA